MSDTLIYPKQAGIYKLTCNINNKVYIGKSVNIHKRLIEHKNCKIGVCHFQYALLKYGWDSFTVEILETFENFNKLTDNENLLNRESYYIELFDSANPINGYNSCKFSNDKTGIPFSEEHKEKLSKSKIGTHRSDITKEKIRKAHTGKIVSDITKQKISLSNTGKKFTLEHKEKLRQSKLGKTRILSEDHRQKILNVTIGNKYALGYTHSEETKKKCGLANIGKKMSEETKDKIRKSKLGKPHSDETKNKIRQTLKNKSAQNSKNI